MLRSVRLRAIALAAAALLFGCAASPAARPVVASPIVAAPIAPASPVPVEATEPPITIAPPPPVPLPPVPLPPEADAASADREPGSVDPSAMFREPVAPRDETRIVVLEYHAIGDLDEPLFLSAKDFQEEVSWLLANHVEIIRMSELVAFLDGKLLLPRKAAVITLDDAHKSARKIVLPMLTKLGVPFTLALNTAAIEEHGLGAMDWDDVKAAVDSGLCELASHSHSHAFMAKLTDDKNQKELELSRALIEEHTGVRPVAFVFPFGSHNARLEKLTEKEGYVAAFAAWGPPVRFDSKRFSLGRFGVMRDTNLTAFARQFRDEPKNASATSANASAIR
jgi:peptidoglycan/xylan/chitin deacetylase (PgdA/CDA1 family)